MIGGAIGAATGSIPIAVAGGIASHHLADMVLHTDTGTFRRCEETAGGRFSRWEYLVATADLLLGGLLLLALATGHPHCWATLAGGLAGITPDLMDNVPFWSRQFRATAFGRAYHAFHSRFHWTAPRSAWVAGLLTQLVAGSIAAWIIQGTHLGLVAAADPHPAPPAAVSLPPDR
jgi:hypothetical protein